MFLVQYMHDDKEKNVSGTEISSSEAKKLSIVARISVSLVIISPSTRLSGNLCSDISIREICQKRFKTHQLVIFSLKFSTLPPSSKNIENHEYLNSV